MIDFILDKKPYHYWRNIGLLILRLIVGYLLFFNHGLDKLFAGPEKWVKLGSLGMGSLGISFGHVFFGFMAAFSESICSLLVILGLFTRPASFLIILTMGVAGLFHVGRGESPESAFLYLVVYFAIFLIGAGPYSLDRIIWKKNS